ncbi:MAG: methylated-DNA--[protein]-cysteine S-methyltransferase [Muribaculaceae bacterium]
MPITYIDYHSPIGLLYIISDNLGILNITTQHPPINVIAQQSIHSNLCSTALSEYFIGKRTNFKDISISPNIEGTNFQKQVWQALLNIPYGSISSYTQIAKAIKNPHACRAVGNANHCNPIPIMIPCHRVIGANGSLKGYALGLEVKQYLLNLESKLISHLEKNLQWDI